MKGDVMLRKLLYVIATILAGGITNCQDWRKSVISHLNKIYENDDHVVIFNPRRGPPRY